MSQSKSKCHVMVISSAGEAWTTRRGARRLIEKRGLAEVMEADAGGNPTVIRMLESDPRYHPPASRAHGPRLAMEGRGIGKTVARRCGECFREWIPDGTWATCPVRNGLPQSYTVNG